MKDEMNLGTVLTKDLEKKWVALTLDHTKVIDSSTDLASLEKRIGNNKKNSSLRKGKLKNCPGKTKQERSPSYTRKLGKNFQNTAGKWWE